MPSPSALLAVWKEALDSFKSRLRHLQGQRCFTDLRSREAYFLLTKIVNGVRMPLTKRAADVPVFDGSVVVKTLVIEAEHHARYWWSLYSPRNLHYFS